MNKKLIWGIVIAVVVIGGTAVYVFDNLNRPIDCCDGSQQKKALETLTADWKTYKNDQYGFELTYPSTWADPIEKDLYGFLTLQFEHGFFIDYGIYDIESTGRVLTFDEVISKPNKEIILDGKRAVRINDSKNGIPVYILYIQGENNKILSVEGSGVIDEEAFDQSISDLHFKFIK